MKKSLLVIVLALLACNSFPQSALTIEKIMQGERFTGYSPENLRWSVDGKKLYFSWNPGMELIRSDYTFRPGDKNPVKATIEERKQQPPFNASYNRDRSKAVYTKDGDIWLMDLKTGQSKQLIASVAPESGPEFSMDEDKIIYISQSNIFTWEFSTGMIRQLTDIRIGKDRGESNSTQLNERDKWLSNDELRLIKTLSERKQLREAEKEASDEIRSKNLKAIYTGSGMVSSLKLSPDQNFVTYISYRPSDEKRTILPNYVTESGYTEDIPARSKVGTSSYSSGTLNIYDLVNDTIYQAKTENLPGIGDQPDYLKDYPARKTDKKGKRGLNFSSPIWSKDGKMAVVEIWSDDHKDRWICLLDVKTGDLKTLDRQRDEAWIGGPGIGRGSIGWLHDNKTVYFQSEESGFSHLYTVDAVSGTKKALTSGNYEIYDLRLSHDGKTWYFISNETDQGIRELYRMPVNGGPAAKLTNFNGGVEYDLSPDEKYFALRVSAATSPWELYIMENRKDAKPLRITESVTDDFRAYEWRTPGFIRIKASDGALVPARLYKPANQKKGAPAVIFVHGAGYLQNAHRWWSSYFREYMFHNFLVDNGYTVLDIDYRGSSGYGRDWRTAIYRHMGGRDLDDHVDAAQYLVEQQQVDPGKIGIYGGSYGGFITLMALFTKPGVFKAGAALRPVTDWAHYNHGYTSNILNTPVQDSLAYVRSSPIYYADGLKDNLLICHGMVDDNVHFQDVVRLTQRLIELGKDNWSLAPYPMESHSFVETTSWVDEYKRIFRLFEEKLK
ncbi:MAG TPA: alpha/beta fold hydrolase [Bacteroidales bacterium]|nr:alpha/beta fold hydrolase [Bacteroidales bacterium]